jgi:hypothetical protein
VDVPSSGDWAETSALPRMISVQSLVGGVEVSGDTVVLSGEREQHVAGWTEQPRPLTRGELVCVGCGYGVSVFRELPRCPMCRGAVWARARGRPVEPAFAGAAEVVGAVGGDG